MIGYASRTGTKTTIAALRAASWRLLVSAAGEHRTEGMAYALENGAWSYYQKRQPFDEARFGAALGKLGRDADFVVMPDIVCGGECSLELTFRWMKRVLDATNVGLIPVQDGHEAWQVDELLGPRVGVFVGGDTPWKLATLDRWAAVCRERRAWCHVGRVNTSRRIAACGAAGATSFDGTSVTKFPSTLVRLDRATHRANGQVAIMLDEGHVAASDRPWWDPRSPGDAG